MKFSSFHSSPADVNTITQKNGRGFKIGTKEADII